MSETGLCPYRPFVEFEVPDDIGTAKTAAMFGPCLQDKCALWRETEEIIKHQDRMDPEIVKITRYCGLAGRP